MSATVVALCVVGVAGCMSATPSPTAVTVETPAATAAPETGSPSPSATPGLGDEMEVGRLDPELTDSIFEFASDGESILFSSGFAEDAGRGASPDLLRYRVHADDQPEVLWRNPDRDHAIVKIAGDRGTVAFVDIPRDGDRAWKLWLIPRHEDEAILLDSHPGDADVSAFVPSFSIQESTIVWTSVRQVRRVRPPGSTTRSIATVDWPTSTMRSGVSTMRCCPVRSMATPAAVTVSVARSRNAMPGAAIRSSGSSCFVVATYRVSKAAST